MNLPACCVALLLAVPAFADPVPQASTHMIAVKGHRLAFHVVPGHAPILVLDAGGGSDSSYWHDIIPTLFARTGSEIITYDRAGSGDSDEVKPPFRIEDAVDDLDSGLQQLGATHDLILVPHSFAGVIDTDLAARRPGWIKGGVLVDTNVPQFYTDAEIAYFKRDTVKLITRIAAARPGKQTRTMAAIAANYPFHFAAWPAEVPCTVIVSERTPFADELEAEHWRQAHLAFTKAAPNRTMQVAEDSSHDVAHDDPKIIIDAVAAMATRKPGSARP